MTLVELVGWRGAETSGPSTRARRAPRVSVGVLGPAFVAAIAYVDPGNFATNLEAGSRFGYLLLWVVALASLMAMVVQYLSAKVGIVTGRDLAEVCRDAVTPRTARLLWVQGELVAAVTDVAELVGAALGLHLLFAMPVPVAGGVAGVVALAVLAVERRGYRAFELVIGALLALIAAGFLYETLRVGPSATATVAGLAPHLGSGGAGELAVGIVGATIMPHAVYLHSSLATKRRANSRSERRRLLAGERIDVLTAMGLAALVNGAMLAVAAGLLHGRRVGAVSLIGAHADIGRLLGGTAATVFSVSLFVAGASSSTVGTYAGDVVMRGFTHLRIPTGVRRALTVLPGVALLALGVDPTRALVLTQVLLAFGIPFALVPLVAVTANRRLMGDHVNRPATTVVAGAVTAVVVVLDVLALVPR